MVDAYTIVFETADLFRCTYRRFRMMMEPVFVAHRDSRLATVKHQKWVSTEKLSKQYMKQKQKHMSVYKSKKGEGKCT